MLQETLHFVYIVTYICDSQQGFGLDIGSIDHFTTRLGTTRNYSATAKLHNYKITTTLLKPIPACCVFTSRSLVTVSKSGDSSGSALKSSLHSIPYRTDLVVSVIFPITLFHVPSRKHRFQQHLYYCMRIHCR
jgi:hypothetical protein